MNARSKSFWRYLANFWTLLFYGLIISDFVYKNSLHKFIEPVSAIYLAVLAVYTTKKEFERWHNYNLGIHPGEMYVIVWTILIVTLFLLDAVYTNYSIPSEVFTSYLVVVGILAITKRSKRKYLVNHRKK